MNIYAIIAIILPIGVTAYYYYKNRLDQNIEKLIDKIHLISQKGCEYWSFPSAHENSISSAVFIKQLNKSIGDDITHINDQHWCFSFVDHLNVIALRQAITGGSFEEKGRVAEPERVERINSRCSELITAIRRSRCRYL